MAIRFKTSIITATEAQYNTVRTYADVEAELVTKFGADHDMVQVEKITKDGYSNTITEFYTFTGMTGKVVDVKNINLGYFDDYRPGAEVVFKTAEGFKKVVISYEMHEGATVDATPEIMQEYKDQLAYKARKIEIEKRLGDRALMKDQAKNMGFNTYHEVAKLKKVMSCDWYEVVKLMTSFTKGTLRSQFRVSLANQIFNWVNDPNPQYKKPLSPKQESTLVKFKAY